MNGFKKVKRRKNSIHNSMVPLFILLILFMGVGYAALISTVNVSGSTKLEGNTWNIYFDNLEVIPTSVETNSVVLESSKTNITYSADLEIPGDFLEFTVDIVNTGTIPGKISLINNTGITPENENIIRINYTYLNSSKIKVGDIINPSETRKVVLRVEIPEDVDTTLLPATDVDYTFQFGIRYIQSEDERILGTLMSQTEDTSTTFGKALDRASFESINIADSNTPPNEAIDSWDASVEQNNSVRAWYTDADSNGKYELYLGGDGGVTANSNSSYLFANYPNVKTMDMKYLNTSNVTNMSYMMAHTGENVTSFEITGLQYWNTSNVQNMRQTFWYSGAAATSYRISNINNWDVSNVTTMQSMFSRAGYDASDWYIGNLSNWNVSKVENMFSLFFHAGYNDTSWSIGDLSNWNTSNVTNLRSTFSSAGSNSTTFNIGNIGNWDVSKVETFYCLFYYAGMNSTQFYIGDLSNWQTGNVTDMHSLFYKAGYNANSFNIGNIGSWDVSKVETFDGAFAYSGYSATTWYIGDLDNWNPVSATDMSYMFAYASYSATSSFDIGYLTRWDTSNVTDMSYMFYYTEPNRYWSNFGTLKVYADNIEGMFAHVTRADGTINMYNNPTNYTNAFYETSSSYDSITINYTAAVTDIDNIIATKGSGNVIKGNLLT